MLNVHCYFIKIFGCQAVEQNMKLDYSLLATCLLERVPNPNFYLSFGSTPKLEENERFAMFSHIEAIEDKATKVVQCGFSFYIVGHIAVEMFYVPGLGQRPSAQGAWCATDRPSKFVAYRKYYL
jgi:hypothetical protein